MLDFIASLLYPKKCVKCRKGGAYICDNCFSEIKFLDFQICAVCQKGSIDGLTHPKCRSKFGIDGIISSIAYKGIVKKLLYQFKYPPYLSDLKTILGKVMYEGLIQQEAFSSFVASKNVYIISVPLHNRRLKTRGYNQAELLAKELSEKLKLKFVSDVLKRQENTKPQFKLKKEERRKNIIGAFSVNPKFKNKIKGKSFLLVDDIATSGSTLRECAKILKKGGAEKVLGITLAHEG